MPEVVVERAEKRFGTTAVLNQISVRVPSRSMMTLLGPSGCGKTTLLRLIAGLEEASGGRITIGDKVVSDPARAIHVPSARRNVGMVFQSYALWPHMRVFDNVAHPLIVRGVSKEQRRERVHDALKLVRLEHLSDRHPGELSGGQQQRVALARAIVYEPDLLLLDEPLSNLDAKLRVEMRYEIRELQQRCRLTSIYVTHDQEEAFAISDLICLMNKGAVEQIGSGLDLYTRPSTRFVGEFVGASVCLSGVVRSVAADGTASVVVGGNWVVCIGAPDPPSAGETIDVLVRPEDIQLMESAGDDTSIPVQITAVTYLGAATEYRCAAAGVDMIARVAKEPRWSVGTRLFAVLSLRAGIAIRRKFKT